MLDALFHHFAINAVPSSIRQTIYYNFFLLEIPNVYQNVLSISAAWTHATFGQVKMKVLKQYFQVVLFTLL